MFLTFAIYANGIINETALIFNVTSFHRRLNNNHLKAIPDNFVTSSASLLRL